MKDKPLILITNDDGIGSPGLDALIEAAQIYGELLIVAPEKQQTGMGRSITGNSNDYFHEIIKTINGVEHKAYYIDASPALVVSHAMNVFCEERKPDLVLAGINYGENLSVSITHSGTVGAALEGAGHGIPSLAISLETEIGNIKNYVDLNWEAAKHFSRIFIEKMLNKKMPQDVNLLKIDIPSDASPETPWEITKLSSAEYYFAVLENPVAKSKISDGVLNTIKKPFAENDSSDVDAIINKRRVSISPMSVDLTSRTDFEKLKKLLNE